MTLDRALELAEAALHEKKRLLRPPGVCVADLKATARQVAEIAEVLTKLGSLREAIR